MLVFHQDFSETIQRITSAQKAADPQFQLSLPYKNANGSDMDVTWNPTGVLFFSLPPVAFGSSLTAPHGSFKAALFRSIRKTKGGHGVSGMG